MKLRHQISSRFLDATDYTYRNPINGQREIVCVVNSGISDMDSRAVWIADEGIYFPADI